MARQTRAQRRARRAETGDEPRSAPPAPPRRPPVAAADGPAPEPARSRPEPQEERRVPGSRLVRFIGESWGELKKVEWPGQHQVITGTTVVIVACVIVGTYLWLNDIVWKHFVQNVLLK
jgi:preprotein translocase subunit SecE